MWINLCLSLCVQNHQISMEEFEKQEILDEIERIKMQLSQFIKISPILKLSDTEKQRRIDIFLDDINLRIHQLDKLQSDEY